MAPIIEFFRYSFLGAGTVNLWQMGLSISMTLLVLVIGVVLFSRVEKSFMDTV
jgi:lipopolysaccharide transport system permease protein